MTKESEMKRKKIEGRILAEGEATGHAHRVSVDVYEREDGLREFSGETVITHEEHKPVSIPAGDWVSGQVMEFDHLDQQLRQVRD